MKLKKKIVENKGSITIEAALVFPWFIFAIVSILFLIKVVFIHDQIQYALNETSKEMAIHSYILHKLDIIEIQQSAYEKVGNLNIIDELGIRGKTYQISKPNIEFNHNFNIGVLEVKGSSIEELKNNIKVFNFSIENLVEGILNKFEANLFGIQNIIDEANNSINDFGQKGIVSANSFIGGTIAKSYFNKHISKEQLIKWNIPNGEIRYLPSEYMLTDSTISIVIEYEIVIPFPIPKNIVIPMKQSVKARAWTGSDDYSINKDYKAREVVDENQEDKEDEEEKEKDEKVYVTSIAGKRYHKHDCFVINPKVNTYIYTAIKDSRRECKTCSKGIEIKDGEKVFGTAKSDVYHIDRQCSSIEKDMIEKDKSEAIKEGYTKCGRCYKGDKN